MSKAKRTLKFTQGLGYGTFMCAAGVGTLVLATATMALAMTGIGVPVAFLTGAGTVGCGAGTVLAGKKMAHKFDRAFGEEVPRRESVNRYTINTDQAVPVVDPNRIQGLGSDTQQDPTRVGSSKPMFSPQAANSSQSTNTNQNNYPTMSIVNN